MEKEHRYNESLQNGDVKAICCLDCGFWHQFPIPSISEVQETYRNKFGGSVRSQFIGKKAKDVGYWRHVFERRVQTYQELINITSAPRILDVGCGVGDFLTYCKDSGFDVYGIEPSESFSHALEARSIGFVPSLIEDINQDLQDQIGLFDVVNMSQFLEHVREPVKVLEIASRFLKPGGILSVECPNDFNQLQLAALQDNIVKTPWWINRLHINYFSFDSLECLIAKSCFKIERRCSQFPIELFLLFGDNYIGDELLGRQIHEKRVRFEDCLHKTGNSEIVSSLYESLAKLSLGRHAQVYARKMEVSK